MEGRVKQTSAQSTDHPPIGRKARCRERETENSEIIRSSIACKASQTQIRADIFSKIAKLPGVRAFGKFFWEKWKN
jgi:hypothetical protein